MSTLAIEKNIKVTKKSQKTFVKALTANDKPVNLGKKIKVKVI